MIPSSIRAVILDAVGTLIHPDPPAPVVYAQVGKKWGSRYDADAVKPRFFQAFQRQEQIDRRLGWRTSEAREIERWRQIVGEVLDDVTDPEACFQALFDHFSRPGSWRCEPDTGRVLTELVQRGFTLGMASNYDSRLHKVMAGKPELRAIHHVIISAEAGWRKPAPEFFAAVCRIIGNPADQILYVGDDLVNDVKGAQAAGLHAIWFSSTNRFESADQTRIICLTELLK